MAQPQIIQITRQELYDQIWSMPVSRACLAYGLSDVGLAKICAEWDIPRPPRGYWARKRSGESIRKKKLRPIEEGNPVIFTCRPGPPEAVKPDSPPTLGDRQRVFEKGTENRITVPDVPGEPDPRVARTEKSIRGAKSDESGIVRPRARQCLDLAVSPR